MLPYLDAIVERLLKLLNASSSETLKSGQASIKCYVQEQVITTLAMVADASETTFERVLFDQFPCDLTNIRIRAALFIDNAFAT